MSGWFVCLQLTVMSSITFNYSYFHGGLFPSIMTYFNAPTRLKNQKAQKYYFLFFSSIADMRRSDTQENERERERGSVLIAKLSKYLRRLVMIDTFCLAGRLFFPFYP